MTRDEQAAELRRLMERQWAEGRFSNQHSRPARWVPPAKPEGNHVAKDQQAQRPPLARTHV